MRYFDGQFDDARLAINLSQTACDLGATLATYLRVTELEKAGGMVTGAEVHDEIGGGSYRIEAKVVINATGPFCDSVRRTDDPAAPPMIKPSGGHIVLDRSFLPKEEYAKTIEQVKELLSGKTGPLLARLTSEMETADREHRFERAAELRDAIEAVLAISEEPKVVAFEPSARDPGPKAHGAPSSRLA